MAISKPNASLERDSPTPPPSGLPLVHSDPERLLRVAVPARTVCNFPVTLLRSFPLADIPSGGSMSGNRSSVGGDLLQPEPGGIAATESFLTGKAAHPRRAVERGLRGETDALTTTAAGTQTTAHHSRRLYRRPNESSG